jgi:hypothetical protein
VRSSQPPPKSIVPELRLAPQELLDKLSNHQFTADLEDASFTCRTCNHEMEGLNSSESKLTSIISQHNRSARHQRYSRRTQHTRTLFNFGVQTVERGAELAPSNDVPNPTHRCHGYYLPIHTINLKEYEARLLLNDHRRGNTWYPSPHHPINIEGGKPVKVGEGRVG